MLHVHCDCSERNYSINGTGNTCSSVGTTLFQSISPGASHNSFHLSFSVLSTARPSGKIARWALTIQELNLTLKHRAGKLNANADAFSRNPIPESENDICCCDVGDDCSHCENSGCGCNHGDVCECNHSDDGGSECSSENGMSCMWCL